jgi:hypothetical protein
LGLVATMTGLIVFTLVVEVWGASRRGTGFVVKGKPCGYVGSCRKKDLQEVLDLGGAIDIDALGDKSKYSGSGIAGAPM